MHKIEKESSNQDERTTYLLRNSLAVRRGLLARSSVRGVQQQLLFGQSHRRVRRRRGVRAGCERIVQMIHLRRGRRARWYRWMMMRGRRGRSVKVRRMRWWERWRWTRWRAGSSCTVIAAAAGTVTTSTTIRVARRTAGSSVQVLRCPGGRSCVVRFVL